MKVVCTRDCYVGSVFYTQGIQYDYEGADNRHLQPVAPEDLANWKPPMDPMRRPKRKAAGDLATLQVENAQLRAQLAELMAKLNAALPAVVAAPVAAAAKGKPAKARPKAKPIEVVVKRKPRSR